MLGVLEFDILYRRRDRSGYMVNVEKLSGGWLMMDHQEKFAGIAMTFWYRN